MAFAIGAFLTSSLTLAQSLPVSGPLVDTPPSGDARLEPIPSSPIHLANHIVYGGGRQVQMRFPPRVNGQNHSDGDKHADLYVLVDEMTKLPVPGQLPIVEHVPKGSAPEVSDLDARKFSAIWEMQVAIVESGYDPTDPDQLIDSAHKLDTSTLVRRIVQTNIFLNCPVVPNGSTTDTGSRPLEQAFYNGHVVTLAPYDIEDGPSNPQVMFKFEDPAGNTLPSAQDPHLVISRLPGDPFYSSIWEVWTIVVPAGHPVTQIRSLADVQQGRFPMKSSHIRLNCPVIAVETAADSGVFEPLPQEDAFAMLRQDFSTGIGRFNESSFRFDVPEGMSLQFSYDSQGHPVSSQLVASEFMPQRTFMITELARGGGPRHSMFGVVEPTENLFGRGTRFPQVATEKGNFLPIILRWPYPMLNPAYYPEVTNPVSAGQLIRISQSELDAGFAMDPPQLPPAIEKNIDDFISIGIMDPSWALGIKPYQERLAAIGRALHELVWQPEQGVNVIDTTSCVACHSLPTAGGAARGIYTLEVRDQNGELLDKTNAGSMWGSGCSELLVEQKKFRGENVTFAHGADGGRDTIRHFVSLAAAAHFGIESTEFIAEKLDITTAQAAAIDHDLDGVVNETTVGEVTAHAAFLLSREAPEQVKSKSVMNAIGVTEGSIRRGEQIFRRAISAGGPGCADCHTPFHPIASTTFLLENPETNSVIPIELDHHLASDRDVLEGYAGHIGQPGVRNYGDFKLHKMGALMKPAGSASTDTLKTAELWDVGSVYPLLRDGSAGSDMDAAIRAHMGVEHPDLVVTRGTQVQIDTMLRQEIITITNTGTDRVVATSQEPLRIVLTGPLMPGTARASNASTSGLREDFREGSTWEIPVDLVPGQSMQLELNFAARSHVFFGLVVQDHAGYSEGAPAAIVYDRMSQRDRDNLIGFLRAQLIEGRLGEGRGGVEPTLPRVPTGGETETETETTTTVRNTTSQTNPVDPASAPRGPDKPSPTAGAGTSTTQASPPAPTVKTAMPSRGAARGGVKRR